MPPKKILTKQMLSKRRFPLKQEEQAPALPKPRSVAKDDKKIKIAVRYKK